MHRSVPLHRFHLDYKCTLDDDVSPKGIREHEPAKFNRDRPLLLYEKPLIPQCRCKNRLVNGFQQPWPEFSMDVKAAINCLGSKLINTRHRTPSRLRAFA